MWTKSKWGGVKRGGWPEILAWGLSNKALVVIEFKDENESVYARVFIFGHELSAPVQEPDGKYTVKLNHTSTIRYYGGEDPDNISKEYEYISSSRK